jgi:hypothetical protein
MHTIKRSLSPLSPLSLLLIVAACAQDVDVRDQFAGAYKMSYNDLLTNFSNGSSTSYATSGTLAVRKGTNEAELVIDERTSYNVKLSGNSFQIVPFTDNQTVNGSTYAFRVTGSGSIGSGSITLEYTGTSVINSQTIQFNTKGFGTK